MNNFNVTLWDCGIITGTVSYTSNLDHWDGKTWSSGTNGYHLGCGVLENGKYFLCYSWRHMKELAHAKVVPDYEAKQTVLSHNPNIYEELFGNLIREEK